MTRLSAADIRRRVDALAVDTAPLRTIAGLGVVVEADEYRRFLNELGDAYVLVRDPSDLAHAFSTVATSGRSLLIGLDVDDSDNVDGALPAASPLLACAQAIADRRPFEHKGQAWPADAAAVVVVRGVDEHHALPRALQRIDFWEFLA